MDLNGLPYGYYTEDGKKASIQNWLNDVDDFFELTWAIERNNIRMLKEQEDLMNEKVRYDLAMLFFTRDYGVRVRIRGKDINCGRLILKKIENNRPYGKAFDDTGSELDSENNKINMPDELVESLRESTIYKRFVEEYRHTTNLRKQKHSSGHGNISNGYLLPPTAGYNPENDTFLHFRQTDDSQIRSYYEGIIQYYLKEAERYALWQGPQWQVWEHQARSIAACYNQYLQYYNQFIAHQMPYN